MIRIICRNCNLIYIQGVSAEDEWTLIHKCPVCDKQWRKTKVSGIKWSVYPKLRKLIESYRWKEDK